MMLEGDGARWIACLFISLGLSLFYFGYFRPHWFSKKAHGQKPSFKDDSYFWQVFPVGLFFMVAGLMFVTQPGSGSLMVAFGCAVWVKILYKLV